MGVIVQSEEPREPIKRVRVRIGNEWISESTSSEWSIDEARSRALSMIERLLPRMPLP